jgi:hypothetical protein
MELSPEDSLRLNVMLANSVAVRIDEGINVVMCLGEQGNEAKVQLNPNCRADQYIRGVRELLSSHVMGSPGGYPVYLKRWTRMGQASDTRLEDLLMLGETEAVVAVTGANGLTDELARRAWWAMPDSDNARRMLARECVVNGEMGRILSEFLMEFLPFEESPGDIIESVKLILQPGLITEEEKLDIWARGKKKNVFQVGFLYTLPNDLPDRQAARSDINLYSNELDSLMSAGNRFAKLLKCVLSSQGQTFLQSCLHILKRPANQDVVVSFLEALEKYFADIRLSVFHYRTMAEVEAEVDKLLQSNQSEMQNDVQLDTLIAGFPALLDDIRAILILAHVGVPLINPIFATTDSVGSVMRKKIEPVSEPIVACIKQLQTPAN